MPLYKKIVVAIDPFFNESENIVNKAKALLANGGKLNLIYVIEYEVPFHAAPFAPPLVNVSDDGGKTKSTIKNALNDCAEKHSIHQENTHVLSGSAAKEIRKWAKNEQADCIVIGSHGRHGVGLLLGSTASSVIHGTPCDILVVRI